jgi:hypothetical protein
LFSQGVDKILIAGEDGTIADNLLTKLSQVTRGEHEFFGLVSTDNSSTTVDALSEWVETQEKVYAVTSTNTAITSESNHTMIAYHPTQKLAEMALAYMLTKDIGSVDLDGKAIGGVLPSEISATEYEDNNINVALEKYGNIVIDGGNMAGGEKIDIILAEFWIKLRMEEDLAQLKMNTPKIPYTDRGVALLLDVANTRLKLAVKQELIALDADDIPEYSVTYLPVNEVPQADRVNREYNYVEWTARLAGSIRKGIIKGRLTV